VTNVRVKARTKSEFYVSKKPLWSHRRNWVEDDEGVAVTSPSGRIYWLNESGSFIWKLCNGKHTIKNIADAMIKRYEGLDRNTATKDLLELIMSLQRLGLVKLL
jgi:hypothetical protein